jgi:hypothetical protein
MSGGESFSVSPCALIILSQNWRKWDKLRIPDRGSDQRPDSEERYVLEHWRKPAEMTVDENQVLRNKKLKCDAVTFLAICAYCIQLLSLMGNILYKAKINVTLCTPYYLVKVWLRPFSTSVLDGGNLTGSQSWPLQFLGKTPFNRYIECWVCRRVGLDDLKKVN